MINSNLEGDVKNIGLLAFDFIEKIKIKSIAVSELVELIMEQAKKKGFGTKSADIDIAEKIALIHSEVSEAYEAYRHKDMNEFKEELGDIVQRVLHLCGIFDIDIEKEIVKKIESNKSRNWRWNEMNEKHS
jgi:NTP pyrophosphatase (non-canonical NTP hydrolase)